MRRFSRRETEILEALYALGEASVSDVRATLDDPPAYDSVRTTLRILAGKNAVTFRKVERRFVYAPALPESRAWKSFARRFADIFFGGSVENAALAMLKISDVDLSEDEMAVLERRIAAKDAKQGSKADGE